MEETSKKVVKSRPCRLPARGNRDQEEMTLTANLVDRIARRKSALTAAEVAVLLACSYAHVCKMAKQGRIPSYRIGGMVRFDPVALSSWLQSRSMGH